jgi:hypothetical protein
VGMRSFAGGAKRATDGPMVAFACDTGLHEALQSYHDRFGLSSHDLRGEYLSPWGEHCVNEVEVADNYGDQSQ